MPSFARTWAMLLGGVSLGVLPAKTFAQAATLAGKVVADSSERPIANVEITLPGLGRTARSDSGGNFRVAGLKAGLHEVVIRMVGYESISTSLRFESGKTVEADFLLRKLSTQLAVVEVREKSSLYTLRLAEFESNRKSRPGKFLTADVFAKASGRKLGDVVTSRIAGVRFVNMCPAGRVCVNDEVLATNRGNGIRSGPCPMQVVLNDLIWSRDGSIKGIITDEIIGLEFYTVSATPAQWTGTGGQCGTVVIHTK